jgi:curli production assembly/transport component CsgE
MWLALLAPGISAGADDDIDSGTIGEANGYAVFEEQTSFVTDRTITLFGGEFYRYFVDTWRRLEGVAAKDLSIVERPSARWGSLVWVEHQNQQLYRAFLYPGRRADIGPLAEDAARHVAARLREGAIASVLLDDPDLAKDEF